MPGVGLRKTIDAVYAAAASPELWPQALIAVSDRIGAIGGLIAFHPPSGQPGFLVTGRLREDLTEPYLRRYAANPFAIALRRVPFVQPILANTLVDMSAIRRSAYCADILAPQKIEGQIALVHPSLSPQGGSGGVSFALTESQLDDSAGAMRRLEPLARHLARAIDVSLQIGRRLAGAGQLIVVLEAMPGAALLLDDRGQIAYANAAAEALLGEADGLTPRRDIAMRLAADDAGEDRALSRAIHDSIAVALGAEADWRGTVRVTRRSGRPALRVLTTPLPAPFHPFALAVPHEACVLVQVLGAGRISEARGDEIRQTFGLTAAEARVAALIGNGFSAPDVARTLNVSLTTVKSHLSRAYDKTEVRSQADLARLLAALPPRSNAQN